MDTLVHLGAGRCRELSDYLAWAPARMVLVEPESVSAAVLRGATAALDHVEVLQVAVSGSKGLACLNVFNLADLNSLRTPTGLLRLYPGLRQLRQPQVQTLPLGDLLAPLALRADQANLLVIDAPGEELRIVEDLIDLQTLHSFKNLVLHCGLQELYEGAASAEQVLERLESQGYEILEQGGEGDAGRPRWHLGRNDLGLENHYLIKQKREQEPPIQHLEKQAASQLASREEALQEAMQEIKRLQARARAWEDDKARLEREIARAEGQLDLIKALLASESSIASKKKTSCTTKTTPDCALSESRSAALGWEVAKASASYPGEGDKVAIIARGGISWAAEAGDSVEDDDPSAWRLAAAYLEHLASRQPANPPRRFYQTYDQAGEDRFLSAIAWVYAGIRAAIDVLRADIILPTYNRGEQVAAAITSVQAQTHTNWQLQIIDYGGSDDSILSILPFLVDERITLTRIDHGGVSSARNTGLEMVTGDYIFYLDSDNTWNPHYLRTLLVYMVQTGRLCAYSALSTLNGKGQLEGYRGDFFNWGACLKGNYVDLNVFGHQRALLDRCGRFDTVLRRMADWDFILRCTQLYDPAYAPFIGCHYRNDPEFEQRVSRCEPYLYGTLVQEKNRRGASTAAECLATIQLRFAIKIAAPIKDHHEWGDFHFAESLADALRRLGHWVRVDFLEDWYDREVEVDDVVLVLRGLGIYEPRPGRINVLWVISHPDLVSYDEYARYDLIYVASQAYATFLNHILPLSPDRPRLARLLWQCTDTRRFPWVERKASEAGDEPALFVGNSRKQYREIVRWAIEAGLPLRIFGTLWDDFVARDYVCATNLDNKALHHHYGTARAVLNDHWASMRDFDMPSNRLFDILACGGRPISDRLPAISRLFGNAVEQVGGSKELQEALGRPDPLLREERLRISRRVHVLHTFDARAQVILRDIQDFLGPLGGTIPISASPPATLTPERTKMIRIGLIVQGFRQGPASPAYIRLIAPLTQGIVADEVGLHLLAGPDDPHLEECNLCIVQGAALTEAAASHVVQLCKKQGMPLVVDIDDALGLAEGHEAAESVRRFMMTQAAEIWVSTRGVRDYYSDFLSKIHIIPNGLDTRLWRVYQPEPNNGVGQTAVRFLYMATLTHDQEFALILSALDRLAQESSFSFDLTLVGVVKQAVRRPWLKVLTVPPHESLYPRFARWLVRQGPFDYGLAPMMESPFNVCKSDIKFLDYTALGLPVIVSRLAPYAEVMRQDLVVSVEQNGWYQALHEVMALGAGHLALADQARDYLWSERTNLSAARLMRCRMRRLLDA